MYIQEMNFGVVNYGKNTGMKGDTDDFEKQNEKPLKYYTTNWSTALPSDAGINFVEGFGKPGGFTDQESQLIRSTITNPKVRQNFGYLPHATTGGLATSGPIISEQNGRDKRSCQPMDQEFYKRSFYELSGFSNVVELKDRQGEDTRQVGRMSK